MPFLKYAHYSLKSFKKYNTNFIYRKNKQNKTLKIINKNMIFWHEKNRYLFKILKLIIIQKINY